MKVKDDNYHVVNSEKECLLEGEDFKLVGFYEDNGMFSKVLGMLQPVYLMNGEYYIEELTNYPLMEVIKSIENTYYDLGNVRSYIRQYLNDIRYHIGDDEFWKKEYGLTLKKVSNYFEIQQFPNDKIIRPDVICLDSVSYIGAIKLPNGQVVIGDEEFIEKNIMENVSDIEERYKLLDVLYMNYKDYHKREFLINDVYDNHYEELSVKEKNKIVDKKDSIDFLIYGLSIMEEIKNSKMIKKSM